MKSRALALLPLLLPLWSSAAPATEILQIEPGVKAWYNTWTQDVPDPANGGKTTSDPVLLIGPTLAVRLPLRLYAEGSYLLSASDYKLSESGGQFKGDRGMLDLAAGYRVIPQVGVFVGYKRSSIDYAGSGDRGPASGVYDLSGPVAGLRGDVSLNGMFGVYATAVYLYTKLKVTNTDNGFSSNEDTRGSALQGGVKAGFKKRLAATAGFRLESTKEHGSNTEDSFSGVTLGVMYTF
jgi:hypothetical protein